MPATENEMLQAHAEKLHGLYQSVDEQIGLLEARESAAASTGDLEQINSLLSEAAESSAAMNAIHEVIQARGDSVPAVTREIVEAATKIVMQLMPKIASMEKSAAQARARLAPQIHAGVRALQMQNAYTRSS